MTSTPAGLGALGSLLTDSTEAPIGASPIEAEREGRDDSVIDIIRGMPNVLIRDVPPEDLEQLRAMAAARGTSLQSYLRGALHAQAAYLRRQAAIVDISERLRGLPEVPDSERRAVLAAVDRAHDERAEHLSGRPAR